jgi:hypothetical protein
MSSQEPAQRETHEESKEREELEKDQRIRERKTDRKLRIKDKVNRGIGFVKDGILRNTEHLARHRMGLPMNTPSITKAAIAVDTLANTLGLRSGGKTKKSKTKKIKRKRKSKRNKRTKRR